MLGSTTRERAEQQPAKRALTRAAGFSADQVLPYASRVLLVKGPHKIDPVAKVVLSADKVFTVSASRASRASRATPGKLHAVIARAWALTCTALMEKLVHSVRSESSPNRIGLHVLPAQLAGWVSEGYVPLHVKSWAVRTRQLGQTKDSRMPPLVPWDSSALVPAHGTLIM